MTYNVFDVAKTICEISAWKITNLKLQKVLYLCHMTYMHQCDEELIDTPFEAWAYGPVNSSLYHKVKSFGNGPIMNVFHDYDGLDEGSSDFKKIEKYFRVFNKYSSSRLVSVTHRTGGPWDSVYIPRFNNQIDNKAIKKEFSKVIKTTSS